MYIKFRNITGNQRPALVANEKNKNIPSAAEIALPLTLLVRKLLREQCWLACWRLHWIHAIHKKGAEAEAKNYNGVHLTAQLSKML